MPDVVGGEIGLSQSFVVGLPSASFLPAAKYRLEECSELMQVQLPKRGSFSKEAGAVFDGPFDICPTPGTILFGDLLKVLIDMKAYPKLDPDQLFTISLVTEGQDTVNVVGRILRIVT